MQFSWFEKAGIALMTAGWLAWGSNWIGDALVQAEPLRTTAVNIGGGATGAPAKAADTSGAKTGAATPADAGALALLASADAAAGAKAFRKCKACHTTAKGGKNKVGPNLWDVVGRAKAGAPGFKFSGALKGLGGAWTYRDLDAFLANPKGFAKGTKMSFAGLKKPRDRAQVIQYLRSLSDQPKPLP